jgi:polysaccharide biosynthesis protein PslJ
MEASTLGGLESARPPVRASAGFWLFVAALVAVVLFTAYTRTQATGVLGAATVLLVVFAARNVLLAWPTLLGLILLVILFIPIRRYTLGGGLPFQLEPYRVIIAFVMAAWLCALLVDPKTRFQATGFEAPILALFLAIGVSLVFNTHRVATVSGTVVKGLTFFLSFFFVMFFVASSVTRRRVLESTVGVIVAGGTLVAISAVVEWRTNYNVFNHLHSWMPLLSDASVGDVLTPDRGMRVRAYASAQHSIALGAALVMIMPLAVYLYRQSGRFIWMCAAAILTLGAMATGSRTGIVMLVATFVVFLIVKRSATIRLMPMLLPLFVVVQVLMPGSLGTFRAVFFPSNGSIVSQEQQESGQSGSGRLADVGPSLKEWGQTPLYGEGFSTRLTSQSDKHVNALILDDQWLSSLLEVGAIGFLALIWLFVRAIRQLGRAARRNDEPHGWLLTALCASITAFGFGMLTFDAFSFTQATFLWFIMLGLGAAALRLDGQPVNDPARSLRRRFAAIRLAQASQ